MCRGCTVENGHQKLLRIYSEQHEASRAETGFYETFLQYSTLFLEGDTIPMLACLEEWLHAQLGPKIALESFALRCCDTAVGFMNPMRKGHFNKHILDLLKLKFQSAECGRVSRHF